MAENRKKKQTRSKKTESPSLSSENLSPSIVSMTDEQIKILQQKVFDSINNIELQKGIDKWMKRQKEHAQITSRDLSILKNSIMEYMDSFLLFGYNVDGERVILQAFESPKDRDAIMEFLKTIFIKQQNENFLDE